MEFVVWVGVPPSDGPHVEAAFNAENAVGAEHCGLGTWALAKGEKNT